MPPPSEWVKRHNPALNTERLVVRFAEHTTGAGALGADQILNSADIFTPANGALIAPTARFHNDPVARCLGVSLLKQVTNGGYTLRIEGFDQFGGLQQEDIVWPATTAFGAALHHIFTRYAYIGIRSLTKIASSGTPNAADRVRIGLSPLAAAFPGTIISPQPNGASLTQYKGFGIPIPLSTGTDFAGAADPDFTSEVSGVTIQHGIAGTADWQYATAISRAGDFAIDTVFNVMIPDEDPAVPTAAAAPADDAVVGFILRFQTNRGE